jgi:predicted PhzF superfamily epimerase YddE/YHI9
MVNKIPLFQVDAFTGKPFAGNPAAVCLLEQEADAGWMQSLGAEMNRSETAFVRRLGSGFELRWFTPTVEVDLCGHATLAEAHVSWVQDWLATGEVAHYHTRSGLLTARRSGGAIVVDFSRDSRDARRCTGRFVAGTGSRGRERVFQRHRLSGTHRCWIDDRNRHSRVCRLKCAPAFAVSARKP